jgi:hypothetical protein
MFYTLFLVQVFLSELGDFPAFVRLGKILAHLFDLGGLTLQIVGKKSHLHSLTRIGMSVIS